MSIKNVAFENKARVVSIREANEQISKSELERFRLEWQRAYKTGAIKAGILISEEKPISQMTPKQLDKEIGKCVYHIGILSHELKKRANA